MKQKIKKAFDKRPRPIQRLRKRKDAGAKISQAIENLPRITNETVAEHREEMLSSARKFIYPLKHSRKRIIKNSVILAIVGVVLFVAFVLVSLYRFQSYNSFMYGVVNIVPLPVAKAGDKWVSYESYLFELRHLTHYYETQQDVDFNDKNGKIQLERFKQRSLQQVIDDAYVKQLAAQNGVSVSGKEVEDAVASLRTQNRLGNNDQEFADVLKEFWGWTPTDFRRALGQQLLAQKLVAKLDDATRARANKADAALRQPGADFAKLAGEMSDDRGSRPTGGEYNFTIDANSRDLPPKLTEQLVQMQPNQISPVIDTGYALEIVKLLSSSNGKLRAAHIQFSYEPVTKLIKPLQDKNPPSRYIKINDVTQQGPPQGEGEPQSQQAPASGAPR